MRPSSRSCEGRSGDGRKNLRSIRGTLPAALGQTKTLNPTKDLRCG
jgi:hypothetical protein